MASSLNLSKVKVVVDAGDVRESVGIRVRSNVATITKAGGTTLIERAGVVSVERVGSMAKFVWAITFDDGSSWEVERRRGSGCGCGQRR